MSDPIRINNFFNRFKNQFHSDSHGSGASYSGSSGEEKDKKEDSFEFHFPTADDPLNHRIFKLAKSLGLKDDEIFEAIDLMLKATKDAPQNADISSVILSNEYIKYPDCSGFENKITHKDLEKAKDEMPDVYLALNDKYQFFCKYPKTLSSELYKKFSYPEVLDFSSKCPKEYNKLSEKLRLERNNEST